MSLWRDAERREELRRRFEERMALPILVAAILLTAVTLALVFGDLSSQAREALIVVDLALWGFFIFDYVVRLTLAPHKRTFVREEWVDGILVVLPVLQPLRLVGAVLRIARVGAAVKRANRSARRLMGRHKLYIALAWATGLVLTAALVVPAVEPEKSKIKDVGDGIWWAVVTTTTVGYGDLVPESVIGRAIAMILMLVGIGIIGLLTANIASFFLEPERLDADENEPPSSLEDRLAEIDTKLEILMQRLDEL